MIAMNGAQPNAGNEVERPEGSSRGRAYLRCRPADLNRIVGKPNPRCPDRLFEVRSPRPRTRQRGQERQLRNVFPPSIPPESPPDPTHAQVVPGEPTPFPSPLTHRHSASPRVVRAGVGCLHRETADFCPGG